MSKNVLVCSFGSQCSVQLQPVCSLTSTAAYSQYSIICN